MTEQEWLNCTSPTVMLDFLCGKASDRKLRLFACAFTSWDGAYVPDLMEATAAAEKWADGEEPRDLGSLAQFYACFPSAWQAALEGTAGYVADWGDSSHKCRATCLLLDNLRCIFGNPFKPVAVDPHWLTSTVVVLGRSMYESKDFTDMPILGDALEDAGCDNSDILVHCRLEDVGLTSPNVHIPYRRGGPHCRGCWVIDLLLGKS